MPKKTEQPDIKRIAKLFSIPITTLQTWLKSDKRQSHVEILHQAMKALDMSAFHRDIFSLSAEPLEVGRKLGFDNPLTLDIDGIPQRTFRSWFETPEKFGLLAGLMIGHQWKMLTELSKKSGFHTMSNFIDVLKFNDIELDGLIRLNLSASQTLVKLLKTNLIL